MQRLFELIQKHSVSATIIILAILFNIQPWLWFPFYGYDWSLHYPITMTVLEGKSLDAIDYSQWYKYTPLPAFELAYFTLFFNLKILFNAQMVGLFLSILFILLLAIIARKINPKTWLCAVTFFILFAGFEAKVYNGTFHSQLMAEIMLLLFIFFVMKRKFITSLIVLLLIAFTGILMSHSLLMVSILLLLFSRDIEDTLFSIIGGCIIVFYWMKTNLFTSHALCVLYDRALNLSWAPTKAACGFVFPPSPGKLRFYRSSSSSSSAALSSCSGNRPNCSRSTR